MKHEVIAMLALGAMFAGPAKAATQSLPCDLRDLSLPTGVVLPSPNPVDAGQATRTARISADVAADGSLSGPSIDVSSGARYFNRGLQDYTGRIVVGGDCHRNGEGRLLLAFRPDTEGWPALAGAWRESRRGPDQPEGDGFPMTFIAGPRYEAVPGQTIEPGEWACEATLINVRRNSIPADDGRLVGDEVHELSPMGDVLVTWRVFLEAEPLALDGDRLMVTSHLAEGEPRLFVGRDGSLEPAPARGRPYADTTVSCPANALPESAYRRCVVLPDLSTTGKTRLIAYNGPCT